MAAFLLHRPRRHDMNQMEIFKNPEFGSIRTFEQDGKVLFCGTDVATALGYANPRKAVRDHTRCGTKCSIGVQTGKKADGTPAVQMVEMLFIPEGDVYRLIVHSKLPSAERFERWVFDEVLPSIRQHGAYLTREKLWEVATSPEALLKLCSDLLAEREKNAALQADNARLQGKAVYYDLFIDLRHSTNLRTTAKELEVPERRFVRFLLERRYVYRTPSGCVLPYTRTLYVLANTVQQKDWDERFSPANKAWAKTVDIPPNPDGFGGDRNLDFVVDSHPGLVDLFLSQARQDYLRLQPLTPEEIHAEAARLLQELRAPDTPNSPHGTHYMARVSPDFLARAGTQAHDQLMALLPFRSLSITGMKDLPGTYVTILASEDRSKELRPPRRSVRRQLKQEPRPAEKKAHIHKKKEPER